MKKLLLLPLFSLSMQAMGMADPEVSRALARSIKPPVIPKQGPISMDVLEPRPAHKKNYQSIQNDEPSEKKKKEKDSWPKFFVYLCCLPRE